MRNSKILTSFLLVVFLFVAQDSFAQRRKKRVVVKTPNKTVVHTNRGKVVYRKPTPKVRVVRTLPNSTVVIKKNGHRYHYHSGVYYRHINGKYVVVSAPYGIRVKTLPVGYKTVVVLGKPYYYYQGTYYVKKNKEYKVVEAPEDVVVYELPEEAEQVTIDGKNYYEYNGKLYKVVTKPEGKAFKVVGYL
ncbi:DUF6515 family protein [Aureivirga sp. CE67]|uniref:DUF6515 family protein n=1 Tax=Aureivirga sp. CE67 TaxID=1788983 RepID=UPI0018CADDE0|nr:DUF6515 family protein [Aureivirga sp. CE67]